MVIVVGAPHHHFAAHAAAWEEGWTVEPRSEGENAFQPGGTYADGEGIHCTIETSGTTGASRIVALRREQFAAHRVAAMDRLQCDDGSRWLSVLPPWRMGAVSLFDRCLHGGGTIAFADRPGHLDAFTHASLVPTQLHRLVGKARPPRDCALIGGDRLDPVLASRALDAGWPVHASYGMTETCGQVTTATPDDVRDLPGTVGRPLRGIRVEVHDDEIVVSGPTVGGTHYTGDLGYTEEGYLYITGRRDDRIISGGVNIDPAHVEQVLRGCPGVVDVAVVGVPDAEWGMRVQAFVVGEVPDSALRDFARAQLPPAARPKIWTRIDAVPRTDQGKVRRAALQASGDGAGVAPGDLA